MSNSGAQDEQAHETLVRAAQEDDLATIRSADSILVDAVDSAGRTALFAALFRSGATTDDDPKTVAAILELGASPNAKVRRKDGSLRSPLKQASIRGLSNVARCLVDAGAALDERGLIHVAAEGGLTWLVERCLEFVDVDIPSGGTTALHDGCYAGSPELVRLLLQRGADPHRLVSRGDWKGFDGLHFAIVGNNPTVVELMLEAGITPQLQHLTYAFDTKRMWAPPIEEVEDAVFLLLDASRPMHAPNAPLARIVRLLADSLGPAVATPAAELAAERYASVFQDLHAEIRAKDAPMPPPLDSELPEIEAARAGGELSWRALLWNASDQNRADLIHAAAPFVDVNLASTGSAAARSQPPLCVAASRDHVDAAKALLESRACPRKRGADNKSAYQLAKSYRMRALLRASRDVWS